MTTMKVAVEGCCHGELDKIYETLAFLEEKEGYKVDLLLICGDFQAVRNKTDLQCMAVPKKFQKLNTFYKYYSGEKKVPVLTVVIGGNHEASNYLQELPYGGWIAPNLYYLGYAGVVGFGGIRIAGMSGIYKGRDYARGHFERPPYSQDTVRSVYHTRNLEVFRLKQLSKPVDVFLSHDWPRGIYNYGNVTQLLQRKKFFKEEVESNTLGSPAAEELMYKLKPDYWFSAHLHCKFPALVEHPEQDGKKKLTRFLALDKCLPRRQFLQVLDIPCSGDKPYALELDPEWLCILKSTNHLLSLSSQTTYMPGPGCSERWDFRVTEEEISSLDEDFGGNYKIPENFKPTAPAHNTQAANQSHKVRMYINPQTSLMCAMLGITDPFEVFSGKDTSMESSINSLLSESANADEISLGDSDDNVDDSSMIPDSSACLDDSSIIPDQSANPDAILLDDDDDEEEDEGVQQSVTDSTDISFSEGSLPPPGSSTPQTLFSRDRKIDQPLCHSSPIIKSKMNEDRTSDISTSQDLVNLSSSSDIICDVAPINTSTNEGTDTDLQPPKVKKFKRRNEALYCSTDDD